MVFTPEGIRSSEGTNEAIGGLSIRMPVKEARDALVAVPVWQSGQGIR